MSGKSSLAGPIKRSATQKELALQADLMKGLKNQGWYADKVSDRFKAGKPDLRTCHPVFGPLDIELKYNDWPLVELEKETEVESGLTKLQRIKIDEYNRHGMPSICLVYFEALNYFGVTKLLRDTLPPPSRRVLKLPNTKNTVNGEELFQVSLRYLYEQGLRYPASRHWG